MNKNKSKYNGIKVKNIWPFYIENINEKFFESLSNYSNKAFANKILPKIQKNFDEDEMEKFNELDSLTKNSKILLMLNSLLRKIVSKTGSKNNDLLYCFEKNKFNEPVFIKSLAFENNFYAHANKSKFDNERKYDFLIEINNDSYLKKYFSNIQLSFFLEEEAKMLSGGFSINFNQITENKTNEFEQMMNSVYLHSLIKHFMSKQLYPLSLENLLTVISNGNEEFKIISKKPKPNLKQNQKGKIKQKKKLNYEEITINDLRENWIYFINRKYFSNRKISEKEKEFFENELFFSILIINLITLSLYEELKIYFTNENPEIILRLLDKPSIIKEDPNQNVETDFYELAKFLNNTYFASKKNKKYKEIKTAEELIETLNLQKNQYEFSFGMPIFSVEVYCKENKLKYANAEDVFNDDFQLKILYLMVIFPELFGMDLATGNFIEYSQLLETIKQTNINNRKLTLSFIDMIIKTKCEFNFDYMSFVGDEPSMFIVKNNTKVKNDKLYTNDDYVPTGLYENYLWAQIFIQSRLWKSVSVEKDFTYDQLNNENTYHKNKIKKLEDLSFSWYDDYYGMSQIKPIVSKIDEQINLRKSIESLRMKIIQTDELSKKDKERGTVLFAYIVATLIGFINFFGMIFTILTVDKPEDGLGTINIVFIAIGCVFAFWLFFILFYFGIKIIKPIRKNKKN